MASKASARSKGSGVVDLREILGKASKFKRELFDFDAFHSLPKEGQGKIEELCSDFAVKCKKLKPTQLEPTDSPLVIGMLVVDNRSLRNLLVVQQEEIDKLRGIAASVRTLNDTMADKDECTSLAIELKKTIEKEAIGKKIFQVMPFPHVRPVKNAATTNLEDLGISPDSEFGKTCVAFWTSYYAKNKKLAIASVFDKVRRNPDKMRVIWYDCNVGQFAIRDNAKRRTTFKHGLFRILKALNQTPAQVFDNTSFGEFAAALLDVTLVNPKERDMESVVPMNERQYGIVKDFLALAALLGEGNTKNKYIENDRKLTKIGEDRLNGKEISKVMTISKEAITLLIAIKFVVCELESSNTIEDVVSHQCEEFDVDDLRIYQGKKKGKDVQDSTAESKTKDWGFTEDEIQLYNALFVKLKHFRELDSKRDHSKRETVFRYATPDTSTDDEEDSHDDTRDSKRQRIEVTCTGMSFNSDDLNFFGVTEV